MTRKNITYNPVYVIFCNSVALHLQRNFHDCKATAVYYWFLSFFKIIGMQKLLILILILFFPISTYAEYWKWIFDQTKMQTDCKKIMNNIFTIHWMEYQIYTINQACWLWMSGYDMWNQWKTVIFTKVAYSTYWKILSIKNWIARVQFNDRYSIPSTYDLLASWYSFWKNDIWSTVTLNIMYNNDLDRWDYIIINEVPYDVTVAQFITLDLSNMNKYCEKTYWKWYKYHLLTHSCKK